MTSPGRHREVAEAAWRWAAAGVRTEPEQLEGAGVHSGWGGIGLALAEVRRTRPWTHDEAELADRAIDAVRSDVGTTTDATWFDGLPGHLDVLHALDVAGGDRVVARLLDLATADGWATDVVGPPRFLEGARINDVTLGTAGVLRAGADAAARGVPRGEELATRAAEVVVAEVQETPDGPAWPYVPLRFRTDPAREMPNWSHGAAGIATALVRAGVVLGRGDLVELARRAAARLVAIADRSDGGLRVPHQLPPPDGTPAFSYGWCHGPSGTAQLFAALADAGVREVAGQSPTHWRAACWRSVRGSGLPARLAPGFWDNDGRCCGTAGVGDLALDTGDPADRAFAGVLADALVERAFVDGPHAWWRFVEHTADEPLLPPGVGWMQGAAGIAAFLFRFDRAHGPVG